MRFTLFRTGLSPVVAAISLIPLTLVYTGCRNTPEEPGRESPAVFGVPKHHFEYCELKPVTQSIDPSGGLASLEAVLRYWDLEITEAQLFEKYPLSNGKAHSIRKLRRIAIDEGLTAFALVMKNNGVEQLGEQLANGRPVIIDLVLPQNDLPDAPDGSGELQAQRTAVVFGQSTDEFLLMDPGTGVVRISKIDLEEAWTSGKHTALIISTS